MTYNPIINNSTEPMSDYDLLLLLIEKNQAVCEKHIANVGKLVIQLLNDVELLKNSINSLQTGDCKPKIQGGSNENE